MRSGEVNIITKTATTEGLQRKTVQSIMHIGAIEPPIDLILRLVRLNQEVMSCERKKSESLRSFLRRFDATAQR